MNPLFRSKTIWTGVVALVTAGAGYATGELAPAQAVHMGLEALLAMFLRAGIAKGL